MQQTKRHQQQQDSQAKAFPTDYALVLERIQGINALAYGRSRNFIDGAVTYLSPYISRGLISTRQVLDSLMDRGFDPGHIEKLIQELAWRDYWQQVWIAKGNEINRDLKHPQAGVRHEQLPTALLEANTGILALDHALEEFYQTGYLHNHVRMYLASLACNVAGSHWWLPARWMYYHLLDADWASNALSWQWVAGANSNKKYYANQENINRYCYSNQRGTFLDQDYEELYDMAVPEALQEISIPTLRTELPEVAAPNLDSSLPTLIYNSYNLDPRWMADKLANRILLLEPSHFHDYPISAQSLQFVLDLAENIPGIQVWVGEFSRLKLGYGLEDIHYKEHPLNSHYTGTEHSRDWMFPVSGYYPSFFAFWKRCKKHLRA